VSKASASLSDLEASARDQGLLAEPLAEALELLDAADHSLSRLNAATITVRETFTEIRLHSQRGTS
jgi:hypothetical protein